MTQELQFFTNKIFSDHLISEVDSEINILPTENIYQCLKGLFQGTERNSSEYVDKFFDRVNLNCLYITESELEKIDKNYQKELKYIFDPKTNSLSLVDEKLWENLEKIIFKKIKDCLDDKDPKKSLEVSAKLNDDYSKLLDLFQKKILFMNIF